METTIKEVAVAKKSDELAGAVVALVKAAKVAAADGFQAGSDIPVLLAAAVAELPKIVADLGPALAEGKEDKELFIKALNLAAYDLLDALKG